MLQLVHLESLWVLYAAVGDDPRKRFESLLGEDWKVAIKRLDGAGKIEWLAF